MKTHEIIPTFICLGLSCGASTGIVAGMFIFGSVSKVITCSMAVGMIIGFFMGSIIKKLKEKSEVNNS